MSEEAQARLAAGVGIALVVVALGYAAPAIGTAVGLAIAAARTGAAAALPAWLVTSSTVVVNVSLVVVGTAVVAKTVRGLKEHLFAAIAATGAVIQGSVLEALKELWPSGVWMKITFQAGAAMMFAIGAFFWQRKGVRSKLVGVILLLIAPIAAISRAVAIQTEIPTLAEAFARVSGRTWMVIGALLSMVVATIIANLVLQAEKAA